MDIKEKNVNDALFWELTDIGIQNLTFKQLDKLGDRNKYKELLKTFKDATTFFGSIQLKELAESLNFKSSRAKLLVAFQRWFEEELEKRCGDCKFVCQSTVVEQFAISKTTMSKFGIEPDKYVRNPRYRSASEMALFSPFRLEYLIRTTPELQEAIKKLKTRRKKSEANKELKQKQFEIFLDEGENNAEEFFNKFAQKHQTKAVALARLIQFLNRYVKSYPDHRERSSGQHSAVDLIYELKDEWLRQNKENFVDCICSKKETNWYIDWNELHYDKDLRGDGEWLDPDDYRKKRKFRLYAYEIDIDGELIRFHSKVNFTGKKLEYKPHEGSAVELTKEERKATSLHRALQMACWALKVDEMKTIRTISLP